MKRVLLTRGAGDIGNHVFVALGEAGCEPLLFDDFSNRKPSVIDRLARIVGRPVAWERGDVTDFDQVTNLFACTPAVNLGTGRGYSVREIVSSYGRVCDREIPVRVEGRRPGDVATCFADPSLAERLLGWRAERSLDEMYESIWRWQITNADADR